jgi:hypothetical protein
VAVGRFPLIPAEARIQIKIRALEGYWIPHSRGRAE